jgi:hypothetical protein
MIQIRRSRGGSDNGAKAHLVPVERDPRASRQHRGRRASLHAGRLVASIALGSTLLLQGSAGKVLAASYTRDCDLGTMPPDQYHMYVHRETTSSSSEFDGVIGEAQARNMATCYSGNPKWGFSAVLPANLQRTPTGGGLVQLGFLEDSMSDATVMVYTAHDNTYSGCPAGCLSTADWYHNGAVSLNSVYRFRIQYWYGPLNAPQWQLCIRNVSSGESYVCTVINRTWGLGAAAGEAWWTYETKNSSDAIGHTNVGDINMKWMQYRVEESTTWFVRTNMGEGAPPYDYNAQGGCLHDPAPSWYHCLITNEIDHDGDGRLDDADGLESWTTTH